MNELVSGDRHTNIWLETTQARRTATGFSHDDRSGTRVPGVQVAFVVPVKVPGSDVAEIKCRGSSAPNVADLGEERVKNSALPFSHLRFVPEACSDERVSEIAAVADVNRRAIVRRSAITMCTEPRLQHRCADRSYDRTAIELQADRDRPHWMSVQIVGCPVEWIDDPAKAARSFSLGALLTE